MNTSDWIAAAALAASIGSAVTGYVLHRRDDKRLGELHSRDAQRERELHRRDEARERELQKLDATLAKELRDLDARLAKDLHAQDVRLSENLHSRTETLTKSLHAREIEVSERQHLEDLWQGVLSLAGENPRFLDVNVTENYLSAMDQQERFMYDIYCHRAWGHVADVVERGFSDKQKFQVAIQWLVTFHHQWLRDNPGMFTDQRFWDAVDRGKSMPAIILRHPRLPKRADGEIDWDAASVDYHSRVLSPLNPAMLDGSETGAERNLLVRRLRAEAEAAKAAGRTPIEIADFGCGNGNLLDPLEGLAVKVVGIDQARDALRIAKRRAIDKLIPFTAIEADLTEMRLLRTFDRIVSVNSILPSKREDIGRILSTVRAHLHPERGVFYAILPSFDTTEHLQQLWYDQFLETSGSEKHARRVVDALRMRKKVDSENLLYADDGESPQCYHTPESIRDDFAAAGLEIQGELQQIHYPWELTRRFDYGYFPEATGVAEIWDWFVVARPGPIEEVDTSTPTEHDVEQHSEHLDGRDGTLIALQTGLGLQSPVSEPAKPVDPATKPLDDPARSDHPAPDQP